MKKLVGIGLAAAISFGALSGCSLLERKRTVLYFMDQKNKFSKLQIKQKEVKEKDFYKMKMTTLEGKKFLSWIRKLVKNW